MNGNSNSVSAAVGEIAGSTRVDVSNALRSLQKLTQPNRIAVVAVLFSLTAWLDLVIDRDLSLFALYLIPTMYAAWYLGSLWAYGTCFASGVVWVIDDWPGWNSYHRALVPYGNLAGRLAVLTIIVAILNALKNAREDQYAAEQRVVAREFEIASDVQRHLLPSEPPVCLGLDVAFNYRPARQLSGDYYDFIPLSCERVAIAVGDVSGKGLPSALLMASLQSLVRTNLAVREGDLTRFMTELSQRVYDETTLDRYVTLFFGILDTSDLTFHYVNAGHNAPLFFRKWNLSRRTPDLETLEQGGPPLGLFPGTRYLVGQISLQEGDVLVLYTDGVSEAANEQGEEYGEERLRHVVRSSISLSASQVCQEVVRQLDQFTGSSPQWDDMTLAIVKVKPELAS